MALRFPACSQALRDRAARALRKSKAFRNDEGGSIAILGAFVFVLLIVFVGVAYDYSKATSFDTAYQGAADAGALYVANATEEIRNAGNTPRAADYQAGLEAFVRANMGPEERNSITTTTLDISSNAITVEVCGTSTNAFGAIVGSAASNPCARAIVNFSVATAVSADVHILVDTSDSMGLAATDGDRTRLQQATFDAYNKGDLTGDDVGNYFYYDSKGRPVPVAGAGCSFACHVKRGTKSTLDVARSLTPPATLRIDVAKNGIANLLDAIRRSGSDIEASLWGFNNKIELIESVRPVDAVLTGAVGGLTLGSPFRTARGLMAETTPDQGSPGNNAFLGALDFRKGNWPQREQYVFLITDGVRALGRGSGPGPTPTTGDNRVFDINVCNDIKAKATLIVLYTKYLDESTDFHWNKLVGPVYPHIEPNMRACASAPEFYAAGDSPAEIQAAFSRLLTAINSNSNGKLRLTQ
jgi:Flp pilus assembly protein TadG